MDNEKYGNDKIIRESVIQMIQYNPRTPTWSLFPIQIQSLDDETDYL